jgi:ABC-type bacteriocin/lantibiotic exporter with double-glycine peptidase domain
MRSSALPLLLMVVLAGCGILPSRGADLSSHAVVLETPQTRQDDLYDCGLAAISALCSYYHVEIPGSERTELARLASTNEGLSGSELRAVLERCGMEVYLFEGSISGSSTSLQSNILAHRPMLVLTELAGNNHYGLVVGFDPDFDSIVLLDPLLGRMVIESGDFERRWEPMHRFALLAVPAPFDETANAQP